MSNEEYILLVDDLNCNTETLVTQLESDINQPINPFTNKIYNSQD